MTFSPPTARRVANLLAAGADPDSRDRHGMTPLMVAANLGHLGPVRGLSTRSHHSLPSVGAGPATQLCYSGPSSYHLCN